MPDRECVLAGIRRAELAHTVEWQEAPIRYFENGNATVLLPVLPREIGHWPTDHVTVSVFARNQRPVGASCACLDCANMEEDDLNYITPLYPINGVFRPLCKYGIAAIWRFQSPHQHKLVCSTVPSVDPGASNRAYLYACYNVRFDTNYQ